MLSLHLRLLGTLGLLALVGCPEPADDSTADKDVDTSTDTDDSAADDTADSDTDDSAPIDADQDGSPEGEDCDDADAARTPGKAERCDSVDNDCDDVVDNDPIDGDTFYVDADSDGYGVDATTTTACSVPAGYSNYSTDCDDTSATTFPGAPEYCNGTDDNCNAATDENTAVDAGIFYADNDGDTYGNPRSSAQRCEAPAGYVTDSADCDDFDADQFPGATEYCNNDDDDCDGEKDEADAVDPAAWYADGDGDGFGDADVVDWTCNPADGFVEDATDCDDSAATTYPGADELCDDADNDCDTDIDESGAIDAGTWYADADNDTYGDTTAGIESCAAPLGYVELSGDCDDDDGAVNPDAVEVCDAIDNDCDSVVDGSLSADADTWYADADSDGFGNAASTRTSCEMPVGFVADATDCNDGNADIYPTATESCDDVDNNCDTQIDESPATDATEWYADSDGDGFGDATTTVTACDAPASFVGDATDCDDNNGANRPDATEVCDGVDNNCDDDIDESTAIDALSWCADADNDGFGDPDACTIACDSPDQSTDDDADCDDQNAAQPDPLGNCAVPYTDAFGLEMLVVSPGTFTMGGGSADASDMYLDHEVTLTHSYWVSETEVTQTQWAAWTAAPNPAPSALAGADHPVERVSWNTAATYANALSAAEGLDPCYEVSGSGLLAAYAAEPHTCPGYRLPTEAEWEFAARAGANTTYAGSDTAGEVGWSVTNASMMHQSVCTLAANAWNLCDMSGNVSEWVNDWYDVAYGGYGDGSAATNPAGPSTGTTRGIRGGSAKLGDSAMSVAARDTLDGTHINPGVGFRLVRTSLAP